MRDKRFIEGRRAYQILQIWDRHKEMMRLHLLGIKGVEIARRLGVTPQNVSDVLNSEIVKTELGHMQKQMDAGVLDIGKRLRNLAPVAVDVLEDTMVSIIVPASIRLKAAESVLDRGEFPKVQKSQTDVRVGIFEFDLEDMKSRAKRVSVKNPSEDEDNLNNKIEASYEEVK